MAAKRASRGTEVSDHPKIARTTIDYPPLLKSPVIKNTPRSSDIMSSSSLLRGIISIREAKGQGNYRILVFGSADRGLIFRLADPIQPS